MSQKSSLTKGQSIGIAAVFFAVVGLVIWGGLRLRSGSSAPARPVEMAPVAEEVTAGPRQAAPVSSSGPMSDEQARRREALENLKFGARQGN